MIDNSIMSIGTQGISLVPVVSCFTTGLFYYSKLNKKNWVLPRTLELSPRINGVILYNE